MTTALC